MKNKAFVNKILPVLLILIIAGLVYLPLINQLGFYRDDWHVTWSGTVRGAQSIIDLHINDRPGMGVVYAGLFALLGNAPIAWQLYALLIRIVGACLFYWILRLVIPDLKKESLLAAVLFVVYPGFLEQPTASAYQCHLTGLAFGLLSIALSLKFINARSRLAKIGLGLAAALFGLVCYFMMEYMIGLEGLRLILFWYVLRTRHVNLKDTLLSVMRNWLPNLVGLIAFLSWRLFAFKSARSVTDVGLLGKSYLADPLGMVTRFIFETIKSFINSVILAWGVPFYNATTAANYWDFGISLLLALLGVGLWLLYWKKWQNEEVEYQPGQLESLLFLGLTGALLPLLPVIISDRQVQFQDTFDRYTLPTSMGVMLIMIAIGCSLKGRMRLWFFGLLLGFSMVTQYNNVAYFRDFWNYERQMWWQLSWRAPDLQDGTTLTAMLPQGYRLAESYEVWAPANLIYRPADKEVKISAEAINQDTLVAMQGLQSYGKTVRRIDFKVDFKNMLVLNFPPGGSCLHVMNGKMLEIPENTDPQVLLMDRSSREDLILTGGEAKRPPEAIFGSEPAHNWCYYYQKASLARQAKDWQAVVTLGDEARSKGLSPLDVSEWMPFYEGYAHQGRWNEANDLGGYLRDAPYFINQYCLQFKANDKATPVIDPQDLKIIGNLCPELLNK